MVTKNKTKKAMSLLSILALMMVVMTAIIVATPIITKRLTQIRVRNNYTKGYFMCYKYYDGNTTKLMQIRADLYDTGTVFSGPTEVTNCQFEVPEGAESFKITLIGGGGGGAGSLAKDPDSWHIPMEYPQGLLNKPRISFTGTSANFPDIAKTFINRSSDDVSTKIKEYYRDNNVYIYTKDSNNKICLFSVYNMLTDGSYGLNKPVALEFSENDNVNLKNTEAKKNYTYFYDATSEPNKCIRISNTGTKCGSESCIGNNPNAISSEIKSRVVNSTGSRDIATSTHSPFIYLTYYSVKGIYGEAGNSGEITIYETPYLRASDEGTTITIAANNIGDGGEGYNGTTCPLTSGMPKGCSGGATTLTIKAAKTVNDTSTSTSTGTGTGTDDAETFQIITKDLTASGGTGGGTENPKLPLPIENVTELNKINGQNGITNMYNNIPIIFTARDKIGEIKSGTRAIADTTPLSVQELLTTNRICEFDTSNVENIQHNTACDGGHANYAGSGGGSAALVYKRNINCATLNFSSVNRKIDCGKDDAGNDKTSQLQYAYGHGGNGAGGAILIEW